MAGAVLFLCLLFVMFQAGYQWRKWENTVVAREPETSFDRMGVWESMLRKL